MKKILGISVVVASLFATNNGYEVGVGMGRDYISNAPINNNNFGNIEIGKYLSKNNILKLEFEKSEKTNVNTQNETLTRTLLNIEHCFDNETKFTPYVFVGTGYQWVSGAYNNEIVADAGVGVKYAIDNTLSTFAQTRFLRDFANNDNHKSFLIGVEYKFGQTQPLQKVEPIQKPKPKPIQKPKPKPIQKPVVLDSDNDGVIDSMDKCPNTPAGVKVDKNGCPVSFNFDITFKNNSSKIQPQFMSKIQKFALFLKNNPAYKAEIEGYTDNKGSKIYNEVLSLKRAKAVYLELIKLGVDKKRLSFVGYGDKNPIASNKTKEGRIKNRRAIAKLILAK